MCNSLPLPSPHKNQLPVDDATTTVIANMQSWSRSLMPRRSMIFATLILVAAGSSLAQRTADPEEREITELAAKPDSWVLEQVGGKRIVLDGQTLDLRMQHLLQKGREAAEAEAQKAQATANAPLSRTRRGARSTRSGGAHFLVRARSARAAGGGADGKHSRCAECPRAVPRGRLQSRLLSIPGAKYGAMPRRSRRGRGAAERA